MLSEFEQYFQFEILFSLCQSDRVFQIEPSCNEIHSQNTGYKCCKYSPAVRLPGRMIRNFLISNLLVIEQSYNEIHSQNPFTRCKINKQSREYYLSAKLPMIRMVRNFHQSLWNCHSGNSVINDRIAFRSSNRERNELWLIRVAVARVAPHLQWPNSISQRHVRSDRYFEHSRRGPRQNRFHDTNVGRKLQLCFVRYARFSRGRRHPRGQRRGTVSWKND